MTRTLSILPVDLSIDPIDIADLQGLMETVHKTVALSKVVFELLTFDPLVFLYKLKATDLRIWAQDIHFDSSTNPSMTFNVADLWKLSEFSSQRTLRNKLIALVNKYPTLEKITYVIG